MEYYVRLTGYWKFYQSMCGVEIFKFPIRTENHLFPLLLVT